MRKTKKRTLAFTIIELMVVSSIISVLASTAMSSLQGARTSAVAAGIKKNISTYTTAMISHYIDHGYYPRTGSPTVFLSPFCLGKGPCDVEGSPADESPVLMQDLDPYVKGTPPVTRQVFSIYYEDDDVESPILGGRYTCRENSDNLGSPCPAVIVYWATPIKPGATEQDMNAACAIPEARAARGGHLTMACDTEACVCGLWLCPEGSYLMTNYNCWSTGWLNPPL